MEGTELIAFNIIAAVGTARSNYIAAIDAAAEGNFDEAENLLKKVRMLMLKDMMLTLSY